MPVLDGSIVQVQLGQRRSVRLRVILPDSPHVLPGRLGADAQARATGLIGIPVAYHRNVRVSWAGNVGRVRRSRGAAGDNSSGDVIPDRFGTGNRSAAWLGRDCSQGCRQASAARQVPWAV